MFFEVSNLWREEDGVSTDCFRTANHRKNWDFFRKLALRTKKTFVLRDDAARLEKHRRIRESMNTWERILIRSSFTLECQSANNRKLGTCTRLAGLSPESGLSCFGCSHRRNSTLLVALSLPFLVVLLLMAICYQHYHCSYSHRFSFFLLLEISITPPVLDWPLKQQFKANNGFGVCFVAVSVSSGKRLTMVQRQSRFYAKN